MRLALLSDIHANLPALEAVLAEIAAAEVELTWCLGDVVGYGAQPDECAALVQERCSVCLVGNHDLAALDALDISTFSPAAAAAVRWTRERMSPTTARFPRRPRPRRREPGGRPLPRLAAGSDLGVRALARPGGRVHPSPGPAGELHRPLARGALLRARRGDRRDGVADDARGAQAAAGTSLEIRRGRWLINPGSVGQPRDGDPRAAWLELDTDAWHATFHRVPYEIDRAADAILATDLPEHLARRLYVGQ